MSSTNAPADVIEAIPVWRHPHLSFVDKILQYAVRWILGLAKLCTVEEVASIEVYRKRVGRLTEGPYDGIVKGAWTVTRKTLTRADGTALELLIHEPPTATKTCVLWIHGGGFILGTAKDAHGAQLMKWLSLKAPPFAWCSLEYRLAPEHPAPAALEDVELAMTELSTYGSLHLAGASAGGALAIAAAAAALRSGVRIASLFAQSPMLDYFDQRTKSYTENGYVSIAPVGWLRLCAALYVGGADKESGRDDWRLCPHTAPDTWLQQRPPPSIIITELADPLRDDGIAAVESLRKANGEVTHVEFRSSHCVGTTLDPERRDIVMAQWALLLDQAAST